MPRRTRVELVGKIEAWETEARRAELRDLLDVLRREWREHLAVLATDSDPQDVADGQITPEYHLQHV
jgi:hypothetical protein